MSGHTHDLDSARETLLVGASPRRYICEVNREIYDFIEKNVPDPEARQRGLDLVAEAFWSGKRMSDRLKEFKASWDKDDWPENQDYEDDVYRRAERLNLLQHIKSVNIGTIDWCNRACEWCPNSTRETSREDVMSEEVLVRILGQLRDYRFTGEIHPYLNGEPSMDSRMTDIVRSCKFILPECKVKIVTNGDGLHNASDMAALFDAGCDTVHMNHYDGPLAGVHKAKDSDFPGLSHFGLSALRPTFYNRAGNVDVVAPVKSFVEHGGCSWFLHKLVFNHRGDLILCCSDWKYEVAFGNIMKDPLASIINSKLYRKYYYAHKEGNGKGMPLCERCNRLA